MSEAAAAPAAAPAKATPAKAAKKAKAPKKAASAVGKPAAHPTYSAMVKAAIVNLKERGGSSKQAILKYILAHYKVGSNVVQINAHLRAALKRGVAKGAFTQPKGTGASGSFRVSESKKAATTAKPKKAAAKPKVKKAPAAKKAASPKKKAAGAKKPKSPKKAKAPAAKKAKSPKKPKVVKPKSPKKAKAPAKPKAKKAAPAPKA